MQRVMLLSLFCFILLPLGVSIWLTGTGGSFPGVLFMRINETEQPDVQAVSHPAETALSPAQTIMPQNSVIHPDKDWLFDEGQTIFQLTAEAEPAIRYFSGQTSSLGEIIPVDPQRLLAGEQLNLNLFFTIEPGLIEVDFAGQTWWFSGIPGFLQYQLGIIVPDQSETLAWDGTRLAPPLELHINACARQDDNLTATFTLPDFDVTGHVQQLVRLQPYAP